MVGVGTRKPGIKHTPLFFFLFFYFFFYFFFFFFFFFFSPDIYICCGLKQ